LNKPSRLISEFETPKQSPGFLLWRVSLEWQRQIREVLVPLDLTHVQFVLLVSTVWWFDQGVEINQALLSEKTGVDKMTVSDVVKTLEKKQLLMRVKSKKDKRVFHLTPTDEGAQRAGKALLVVQQADREFFAHSTWPQEKIVELLGSLTD
jgi:DNA-binding MarR family transcriptional regulator